MSRVKRRTAAEWRQIVAEYRESGLSLNAFSEERGVSLWSLRKWQCQLGRERHRFVEVSLAGAQSEYTLVLRGGRELKISGAFSEQRVRQLISVLEQC